VDLGGSTNYGLDLAALDVQRGWELGLPSSSLSSWPRISSDDKF